MGNNEPAVDQSDLRIRSSYGLNMYIHPVPGTPVPAINCALRMLAYGAGRGRFAPKSNTITFSSQDRVHIRAYTRTRTRHPSA